MKFAWFSFKNKIGLIYKKEEFVGGEKEVVLSWLYKACFLEGGNDKRRLKAG
jgi:hypothetical protein